MPKTYFCWRCRKSVPFLSREEWDEMEPLLSGEMELYEKFSDLGDMRMKLKVLEVVQQRTLQRYFEITGCRETNPEALYHHRISIYGRECPGCGGVVPHLAGSVLRPLRLEGESIGGHVDVECPALHCGSTSLCLAGTIWLTV